MKTDLAFVCGYLKALVIPCMPDGFTVAEPFRHGLTDDDLRKGMTSFRDFLYALFDKLAADKDKVDVKTGAIYDPYGSKGDRGTSSLKHCFPVFFDVTILLFSLGFHGRLDTGTESKLTVQGEDMRIVICPVTEKYQSVIRMSGERKLELFRLLTDMGLRFEGADFSKEVEFSKAGEFHITSSQNEHFAVGLKLITEAMMNNKYYIKQENMFLPVFLRGDFYPLKNATPKKHVMRINEFASPQTPELRVWIKDLEQLLIANGCTMTFGDGKFQYQRRGKNLTYGMVCIIDIGITGCFITPGVNHLAQPGGILSILPGEMADSLKSSKGSAKFNPDDCFRKSGNMGFARFVFTHNGEEFEGCRHAGLRCRFSGVKCRFSGYSFDLAHQSVRDLMRKWIELELSV